MIGSKAFMQQDNPSCPLEYRYSCKELTGHPERTADVLYVVGGLYGNLPALDALEKILEVEPNAEVMFNGDFNWFNIDDHSYVRINSFALEHAALKGNVETELSQPDSRGCGCDYPGWVDSDTVSRSDQIIAILKNTAVRHPELTARLSTLPRYGVYNIGNSRVGVVHGDAESLAGWGFAQEHLSDPEHLRTVQAWFEGAQVEVYACSHTCLPVLQRIEMGGRRGWIVNNGSAGMPNFSRKLHGLVSRIAVSPCKHIEPVYGSRHDRLYLDAIPLYYDHAKWIDDFLRNWPRGSAAHLSYFGRIEAGPDYRLGQARRF